MCAVQVHVCCVSINGRHFKPELFIIDIMVGHMETCERFISPLLPRCSLVPCDVKLREQVERPPDTTETVSGKKHSGVHVIIGLYYYHNTLLLTAFCLDAQYRCSVQLNPQPRSNNTLLC